MKAKEKAMDYLLSNDIHGTLIKYDNGALIITPTAKLMTDFAEKMMHDLVDRYEEKIQSKVPELRKLVN